MGNVNTKKIVLAHWTYTKEEWMAYNRWRKLRKGFLYFIIFGVFQKRNAIVPEITITNEKIWTDDIAESFINHERRLKRINIKDTGTVNILEITYQKQHGSIHQLEELNIPVPKGKLKEAMEVQQSLMEQAGV